VNEGFVTSTLLPLAQVDPTIMDVLNDIEFAKVQLDNFGADPSILRTDEEIAGIRQNRQKQQQAQAQSEQLKNLGAGAKGLGQTPMDGDTALTRLVSGLSGAA
jgi:hypothetical protein